MKTTPSASSPEEEATIRYVCGIDIGSQSCSGCVTRPDKSVVVKPMTFANTQEGWKVFEEKLTKLDAAPNQIVIGMEATSRYHENLYHELEQRGYQLRLLHPGQTHHFHQQQGLRAKTDRLDAMAIARTLRKSGKRAWAIFLASRLRRTASWCGCTPSLSRRSGPLSEPDPGSGGRAFSRVQPDLC